MCCVSFCRIRHISAQTSLDPLPPDLSLSRLLLPRGHFRDFPLFPSTPPLSLPQDCFLELFQTKTESGGRERPGERGRHFTHSFVSSSVCPSPLSLSLSLSPTHFFCPPAISPHFPNGSVNRKKPPNHREKKPLAGPKARERVGLWDGWMDGSSSAALPSPPKTLALLIHLYRVSSSPTPIDLSPQQPRKKFRILLLDAAARSIHPLLL